MRRLRWVHRLLFGYWPHRSSSAESWDWTTLVLTAALSRYAKPASHLLDMGTGSFAVLAIYAQRVLGVRTIVAVDVIPEVVRSAQAHIEGIGTPITCVCGDLFDPVVGRFDIIVMNAPYIVVARGRLLGILRNELEIQRFSGGEHGDAVIRRFLASAPAALSTDGRVILGVNHHHLSEDRTRTVIRESFFTVVAVHRSRITGSAAYVLHYARPFTSESTTGAEYEP